MMILARLRIPLTRPYPRGSSEKKGSEDAPKGRFCGGGEFCNCLLYQLIAPERCRLCEWFLVEPQLSLMHRCDQTHSILNDNLHRSFKDDVAGNEFTCAQ